LELGFTAKTVCGLTESAQKGGGHVMISYNWGSQSTVLQLRDRLKAAGFNIWIDVEHMSAYI